MQRMKKQQKVCIKVATAWPLGMLLTSVSRLLERLRRGLTNANAVVTGSYRDRIFPARTKLHASTALYQTRLGRRETTRCADGERDYRLRSLRWLWSQRRAGNQDQVRGKRRQQHRLTTDPYGTEGTSLNAKSGFQLHSTPRATRYPRRRVGRHHYVGISADLDDYEGGELALPQCTSKAGYGSYRRIPEQPADECLTGIQWPDLAPPSPAGSCFGTWPGSGNGNYSPATKLYGEDLHPPNTQLRLLLSRRG